MTCNSMKSLSQYWLINFVMMPFISHTLYEDTTASSCLLCHVGLVLALAQMCCSGCILYWLVLVWHKLVESAETPAPFFLFGTW